MSTSVVTAPPLRQTSLRHWLCRMGIHTWKETSSHNIEDTRWLVREHCPRCLAERSFEQDEWDQMRGI